MLRRFDVGPGGAAALAISLARQADERPLPRAEIMIGQLRSPASPQAATKAWERMCDPAAETPTAARWSPSNSARRTRSARPAEVGRHIIPAPSGAARGRPSVIVPLQAPDVDGAFNRAAAAPSCRRPHTGARPCAVGSGSQTYSQSVFGRPTRPSVMAGMSFRKLGCFVPASRRMTLTAGFSDSRAAKTQPALPVPR